MKVEMLPDLFLTRGLPELGTWWRWRERSSRLVKVTVLNQSRGGTINSKQPALPGSHSCCLTSSCKHSIAHIYSVSRFKCCLFVFLHIEAKYSSFYWDDKTVSKHRTLFNYFNYNLDTLYLKWSSKYEQCVLKCRNVM